MKEESSNSQRSNTFKSLSLQLSRDWTSLPDEIIENVAYYLTSRNDTINFRGACRHFRRLLIPPSKTLFPHPKYEIPAPVGPNPSSRGHYLLRESTIYSVEPRTKTSNELQIDAPWIVKIEELETPRVRLKDVLSRFHFEDVYNYSNLLANPLNLLQIRSKELAKSYHLELSVPGAKVVEASEEFEFGGNTVTFCLQKAVVTSWADVPHVGFTVMALHDGGLLHAWRKEDKQWTAIDKPAELSTFADILYADKKFYVVDDGGNAIAIDPRELTLSKVASSVPFVGNGSKFLVNSSNDLFMVYKYWEKGYPVIICRASGAEYPVGVFAYKLDKETSQWVKVTNELQNQVIFVGEDASFSISADELPGCSGNLIYVTDIVFSRGNYSYPGWNVGVFDLDNKTGNPEPISMLSEKHRNMLWPPPEWLKSSSNPVPIARAQPSRPF